MERKIAYEDRLRVSPGMAAFWCFLVAVFLAIGIAELLIEGAIESIAPFAVAAFFLVAAFGLTPKRLIVYSDAVVIRLYLGYAVAIPAARLKEVKKLPRSSVFLSQDVPFKSRWSVPVHITQKRGPAYVVTPTRPDEFVARASSMVPPSSSGPLDAHA